MSKGNKLAKSLIAGAGIVSGLAAIGAGSLIAARINVRKTCSEFYDRAQRQMVIPGLKEGFVPQDLFYVDSADSWLFSGYDPKRKEGKVSPIYKIDAKGNVTKICVELPSGVVYKGHGAAICTTDEHAFLTVKDGYVVMSLTDLLSAADGSTIKAFAHVPVELEPAFMNIQDGVLYIGEFYHKLFYNTPRSHWLKCPSGVTNPALMYAYDPSDASDALFGFAPSPSRVYSIPGDVQGMCVAPDDRIVLSLSWGIGDAKMLVYDQGSAVRQHPAANDVPKYLVAGEEAPLHFLSEDNLQKTITLPPMAEGIDFHDGQVWLTNESASDLYVFGKFNGGKFVYSIAV